jgi:putative GTP pyrophosphokinase
MANFVEPQYSKSQVTKAGQRIAGNSTAGAIDYARVENWRASHAWVINTFQANLRRRSRGTNIVVGTRLKRRVTIFNKLKRYPQMQLGRMHDIAGCRVIFPDVQSLIEFRQDVHRARFAHTRKSVDEEKWNYIDHPKLDGYRGIHDVYEYDTRSNVGQSWKGLQIEIQYRTLLQHSWATAVEVAGLLTHNNPKFGQGAPEFVEFFAVSSELLARRYEEMTSCFPDADYETLKNRLQDLENNTRILQLFRRVNSKIVSINFKNNNILIFPFVNEEDENSSDLEVHSYGNLNQAIEAYNKFEKERENEADIVLVRADNFENMRITFRNYFADTTDFVSHLDEILEVTGTSIE